MIKNNKKFAVGDETKVICSKKKKKKQAHQ